MKRHSVLKSLLLLCIIVIAFNNCKKENNETTETNISGGSGSGTTVRTTLCGVVTDENGQPVSNALIRVNTATATSNNMGIFTMVQMDVPARRCIINFSKPGFLDATQAVIPSKNNVTYIRVSMFSDAVTHTLDASVGGTISLASGTSILFPPNAFVKANGVLYSGMVSIVMHQLATDNPRFRTLVPGKDLMATDASGTSKILYSST